MDVNTILFVQHGWADTNRTMLALGQKLQGKDTLVCAPDLGWWRTWGEFDGLQRTVRDQAAQLIETHDRAQIQIIGHSLGGLIWLEILAEQTQWWPRVHSLVLLGSPVGGAELGRILDPLQALPLIARDLGKNRRAIATQIAKQIPTLVIAGDWDGGSDGTISIGTTKFLGANWHCIRGAHHAQIRLHPQALRLIRTFWQNPTPAEPQTGLETEMLDYLYSLSLTDAHPRDVRWARPLSKLREGYTLWTWTSPILLRHIFITNPDMEVIYGAFVAGIDYPKLDRAIEHLIANFS